MEQRFNIRVYGILINNGKLLVNEEMIRGKKVIKLPGGGLDFGEGIADCLVREWKEELALDINILRHYYTTDFFVQSAYDKSQIISVYYLVEAEVPEVIVNHIPGERTYWLPMEEVNGDMFTLVIDKYIGNKLKSEFHPDR